MSKDREIICRFYTCAGGTCEKRGIPVHFRKECKTCAKYDPVKGARPARVNRKREKLDKVRKKEY